MPEVVGTVPVANHLLWALGVPAARALHVGDNLLSDISGAAGVGMKTAWIAGHDSREPVVAPDFVVNDITEVPDLVERWLENESRLSANGGAPAYELRREAPQA